jgi:hypothetical protein
VRWQQQAAERGKIKPLVRRAFNRAIVKIEAVNVDVGNHAAP